MIEGNFNISFSNFNFSTGHFKIPDAEITMVYGDSGCGKTTFLNSIAGIEKEYKGSIHFKKPLSIGYVFQENSLFPHLNVKENLLYALKRCRSSRYSLDNIVTSLAIDDLLENTVDSLSGGQIQRVSIARAILSSPDILLLDEPLSALHLKAKNEILNLIKSLNKKYKIPIVMVTHSVREVVSLCDNVIYMKQGDLLRQMNRDEALLQLDSNGPINCISNKNLSKLGISFTSDNLKSFIVHSSNVIPVSKNENTALSSSSIPCTLDSVSVFSDEYSLLKLRYFEDNFLYSKVRTENSSYSVGQELMALFGPASHII